MFAMSGSGVGGGLSRINGIPFKRPAVEAARRQPPRLYQQLDRPALQPGRESAGSAHHASTGIWSTRLRGRFGAEHGSQQAFDPLPSRRRGKQVRVDSRGFLGLVDAEPVEQHTDVVDVSPPPSLKLHGQQVFSRCAGDDEIRGVVERRRPAIRFPGDTGGSVLVQPVVLKTVFGCDVGHGSGHWRACARRPAASRRPQPSKGWRVRSRAEVGR